MEILLLYVGQDVVGPTARLFFAEATIWIPGPGPVPATRRQVSMRGLVIQERQPNLLEVIQTLCSPSRLSRRVYRRQQQQNQDGNNGYDHQ